MLNVFVLDLLGDIMAVSGGNYLEALLVAAELGLLAELLGYLNQLTSSLVNDLNRWLFGPA